MPGVPTPEECRRLFQDLHLDPSVVNHVEAVAALAKRVAEALQNRGRAVNAGLVHAGALLHDLGRSRTHGLDHASVGARLLRERGYPEALCLCVERHTGGGIDLAEARALGLPPKDYTPRTLEEKIVCQVDNLLDGSLRQSVASEVEYLNSLGLPKAARKVAALHRELSDLLGTDLDQFPG